jgi:hypothetical protein
MATMPYSRSGMDPFQQALRKRKKTHAKAHAEALRRYACKNREQINAGKRRLYLRRKNAAERLAWKGAKEAQEKADLAARLEALHWAPPPLTLRDVLGY